MLKSRKLKRWKYAFIFGVFLAVFGAITGYSLATNWELVHNADVNVPLDIVEQGTDAITSWVRSFNIWGTFLVMPATFLGIAGLSVFRDELKKYFKMPRGVAMAIALLGISIIVKYMANYVIVSTSVYLFVTIVVSLYFDPAIERALKEEENDG